MLAISFHILKVVKGLGWVQTICINLQLPIRLKSVNDIKWAKFMLIHQYIIIFYMFKLLIISCIFFIPFSQINAEPIRSENCVSCHQQQVNNWQQSDHAKAMDIATAKTVLGNFDNATFEHFTQQATFSTKNGEFWVSIKHQDKTSKHQVDYTFGHYPLQQYLVKTEGGRYQVLPYAWDSRTQNEGGQRWYTVYVEEDIKPNDRLHWQQPLQNWNGMCADCHSDGLTRNYASSTNSFDTSWDNINVGCQSCHTQKQDHANIQGKHLSPLSGKPGGLH